MRRRNVKDPILKPVDAVQEGEEEQNTMRYCFSNFCGAAYGGKIIVNGGISYLS